MTELDRREVNLALGNGQHAIGVAVVEVDEVSLAWMIRQAILSAGKRARRGAVIVSFRGVINAVPCPSSTTTAPPPPEAAAGTPPAGGGCPPRPGVVTVYPAPRKAGE